MKILYFFITFNFLLKADFEGNCYDCKKRNYSHVLIEYETKEKIEYCSEQNIKNEIGLAKVLAVNLKNFNFDSFLENFKNKFNYYKSRFGSKKYCGSFLNFFSAEKKVGSGKLFISDNIVGSKFESIKKAFYFLKNNCEKYSIEEKDFLNFDYFFIEFCGNWGFLDILKSNDYGYLNFDKNKNIEIYEFFLKNCQKIKEKGGFTSYVQYCKNEKNEEFIKFEKLILKFYKKDSCRAIKNNGSSAGLPIFISIYSLLKNEPVPLDVAMTGEIDLHGNVLPVGGIKEKVDAGKRNGVKKFFIPSGNKIEVFLMNKKDLEGLEIFYVDHVDDVLKELSQSYLDKISLSKDFLKNFPKLADSENLKSLKKEEVEILNNLKKRKYELDKLSIFNFIEKIKIFLIINNLKRRYKNNN